jgi:hypothetical protein
VLAPITSRINGEKKRKEGRNAARFLELQNATENLKNATPQQRKLYTLLRKYHTDAVKIGAWNKPFPENFLENFAAHTKDPGFETAAQVVRTCFARIKGEGNFEPMEEYKHPGYRKELLKKVMRMTEALATGDKDFVQSFAAAAEVAQRDCQNNAFQIFQKIWQAVRVREVRNIKDPDIREKNLLLLAMDEFRVETLRKGTSAEFKEEIDAPNAGVLEVEYILAAEVALGNQLALLDPAKGIAYSGSTKPIEPTRLEEGVHKSVKAVVTEKEFFIEYLRKWHSIQDHLNQLVKAKYKYEEKVAEFSAIRQTIEDNTNLTPEERETELNELDELEEQFKQDFYREFNEIRENQIREMLNRHPEVMEIRPGTRLQIPDEPDATPAGLDAARWGSFVQAMNGIVADAVQDSSAIQTTVAAQYAGPEVTSETWQFTPADMEKRDFKIVNNAGGGDCLFHALGVPPKAMRAQIAQAIMERPDNLTQRAVNAMHVASALSQTPATAHLVDGLTQGRHAVPNQTYAQLVAIPGIYAGEDELLALSTLAEYRDKSILLVDHRGSLARICNGELKRIDCKKENKDAVLDDALRNAHIALYKTDAHWQRIERQATGR